MTRLSVVLAAILVAAGLWAYWPSFSGVLVLDDLGAIPMNPTIQSLGDSLSPPPNTSVSGRPVANLSFAINYAIAPSRTGLHVVNFAIHVVAALLLFGVVRRTLVTPPLAGRFEVAAPWLAAATALIWFLHPLQTEAVTYVVQRVESLMSLFLLLTLYAAIRAMEQRSPVWAAGAVMSCALGMATKEVMVVTPVVVWLWHRTFRPRAPWPGLLSLLPATWLVLLPLVMSAPRGQTAGFGVGGWTSSSYLLTQTGVVVHYLRLIFVPDPLVFHYAWPKASSFLEVAPQALLLVLLAGATIYALVRRHPLGFAGAWFFLILAPSSSIVPVATEVAAEHRVYLAMAAVIAVVVLGVFLLGTLVFRQRVRMGLVAGAICVTAIAVALGVRTYARNMDYTNEERLWRDTVEKQPGSPRAQLGYGVVLVQAGRMAEAEPHLRAAVAPEPMNPLAHRSLGLSLAGQQRLAQAVPELQRALELWPADPVARKALTEIAEYLQRIGR